MATIRNFRVVQTEGVLQNAGRISAELAQTKAEERWGAGVVEQVSLDLQREFSNADGFSVANLWFMKKWYLFYSSAETSEKLYQLGREIGDGKLLQPVIEFDKEKLQQPVGEFWQLKERMELLQKEMRETKRLMKANK